MIITFILWHAFVHNKKSTQTVATFIHLPSLSLSTSYLEPRFRVYDEELRLYPKMKPIDFMGFVYE